MDFFSVGQRAQLDPGAQIIIIGHLIFMQCNAKRKQSYSIVISNICNLIECNAKI